MRAIEAYTETDVIGADRARIPFGLHPDNTLHFQYTSGPQPVRKVV